MTSMHGFGTAGAIVFAVLTLLHLLVWRAQGTRWSALLALTYASCAVVYFFDEQTRPGAVRGSLLGSTAGAIALVSMTLAMIDYVGLPQRIARTARWIAISLAVLLVAARLSGLVPHLVGSLTFASYFLAQGVMVVWAMRREPRRGHGLVLVALLLYPAAVLMRVVGWVDPDALRYVVIVPAAVGGMTILTTGLLRAQAQAAEALEGRAQAEAALRQLNDGLELQVAQRTSELREMVTGLESFNRSVSHDLRGPLGGIAGVSRMAAEAAGQGDLATVQRLLPAITAQAESSTQLVEALLTLARVGEVDLAPRPIATEAFVRETLEMMAVSDPVAVEVPVWVGPLPQVRADPVLLRQLLVNLIGNAQKFSRGRPSPRVEVGAESDVSGVPVLFVRDNGVGFDESRVAELFEPFHRLHGTAFQGHGVGLSIVRRIAERHGGQVWAASDPAGGAVFRFTLQPGAPLH